MKPRVRFADFGLKGTGVKDLCISYPTYSLMAFIVPPGPHMLCARAGLPGCSGCGHWHVRTVAAFTGVHHQATATTRRAAIENYLIQLERRRIIERYMGGP